MKKLTFFFGFLSILLVFSCTKENISSSNELADKEIIELINGPQTEEDQKILNGYVGTSSSELTYDELKEIVEERRSILTDSEILQDPRSEDQTNRCQCTVGPISYSDGTNAFIISPMGYNAGDAVVVTVKPFGGTPGNEEIGDLFVNNSSCITHVYSLPGNFGFHNIIQGGKYKVTFYSYAENCMASRSKFFIGE